MILILVRFMQIGRARESWQITIKRFMDLPAFACSSNLHEPHQNKKHSLSESMRIMSLLCIDGYTYMQCLTIRAFPHVSCIWQSIGRLFKRYVDTLSIPTTHVTVETYTRDVQSKTCCTQDLCSVFL